MQDRLDKVRAAIEFSNKVLVRELAKDFEDKGIAPVWDFDGKSLSLGVATKNCQEIIGSAIESCGFKHKDFCILQDQDRELIALVNKERGAVYFYDSSGDDLSEMVLLDLQCLQS